MPIQPTYPGVYIQEISSGVRTITGVATSIAAFFGRAAKGSINKAVHCTSYSDFLREFGGADWRSDLANSVKQFYDNGGSECYVVRLAHKPNKANIILKDLDDNNVLVVSAKNEGVWGNNLRLEVDYNTAYPDETFNLRVFQEENGNTLQLENHINLSMNPSSPRYVVNRVTQESKLIDVNQPTPNYTEVPISGFSESRRPIAATNETELAQALNAMLYPNLGPNDPVPPSKFQISVNDGAFIPVDLRDDTTELTDPPVSLDALMSELDGKINPQLLPAGVQIKFEAFPIDSPATAYVLRLTSVTTPLQSVKIRLATAGDLAAPLMFGVGQGGVEVARYANHRPVPNGTFFTGKLNAGTKASDDLNTLAVLKQNAFREITMVGAPSPGNVVNLAASGTNVINTTGASKPFYEGKISTINGKNDGVREKLQFIAQAVNNTPKLPVRAEVWGYHLVFLPKSGAFNKAYDIKTSNAGGSGGTNIGLGGASNLFTKNVRQYALGSVGTSPYQVAPTTIPAPGAEGKDDDGNPPDVADYTGDEFLHTGFYALDKADIFNLMVLPGDTDLKEEDYQVIAAAASVYCEKRRAFLLTDAPNDWSANGNLNQDELKFDEIRTGVKKNMAAFYPRVIFSDRGLKKPIGASGMIAGLMARTDSQRGVWKAPAGTEADLRGAFDLEVNLTDIENGILNKQGVNCIRKFPNGIVNWGARTLDGADDFGSEWKYIPIRRLALFLEESLFRGTKWVVFEPNDEPLWAKIRLNINAFMMGLFRQGAFQGSTPDKAFFVKCDAETTTQADRNLGIVNIVVGFAPLKPAEFVIISIQQMAGDLV